MPQYSHNNQLGGTAQALSTAYKTICAVYATTGATTLRQGFLYEVEVGADAAPNANDCAIVYDWSRMTADGTGTTVTPPPLMINDAAALLTYKANYTVEGTVTAATNLLSLALNQRASQRWIAKDDLSALVIPAVNLAGIVGRAKSTVFTGTVDMQQYVRE